MQGLRRTLLALAAILFLAVAAAPQPMAQTADATTQAEPQATIKRSR